MTAPGVEPLVPEALLELLSETVLVVDRERNVVQAAMSRAAMESFGPLPVSIDRILESVPCIADGRVLEVEELPVIRALNGETCRDVELIVAGGRLAGHAMTVSASPIVDADGAVAGAFVVVDTGIAEGDFIQARAPLRAAFDHAAIGLMILTRDGFFVRANGAALSMLGYSQEELCVRHFLEITHPDDSDRSTSINDQLADGRLSAVGTEKRYLRADGTTMWGRVTVAAAAPRGVVEYLVATLQDITSEREVADALQESRGRLAAVVAASPVAIIAFDVDGTIQDVEGAVASDDDRSALIGRHLRELRPGGRLGGAVKEVLRGSMFAAEGVYDDKTYQCHFGPVRDDAGEVVGGVMVAVDQSEVAEARMEMERSERRFRALSERASDLAIICDENAVMHYVAPASLGVLGYEAHEVQELSGWDFIHPDDVADLSVAFQAALAAPGPHPAVEFRARHKDGTYRWVEERFTNLFDDPDVGGMVVNLRDIHEARAAREALVASEARYRSIVEGAHEGIVVLDQRGSVIMSNGRLAELLGTRRSDLIGYDLSRYMVGDGGGHLGSEATARTEWEQVFLRADGSLLHALVNSSPIYDHIGAFIGTANMVIDIGERKRHEAELERMASFDHLTGLPNRRLFIERLENVIAAGATPAVLFLDLDDFKTINDSFGHLAGDEVLRAVAETLQAVLDDRGYLARFSGDEFVACLPSCVTSDEALSVVAELMQALRAPFVAGGREVYVTVGVGVAGTASGCPGDAQTLLAQADAAMYRAKRAGRGSRRIYDGNVVEEIRRRLDLDAAMRRGLGQGAFSVAFQPVVEVATGRTIGAEALCRWTDPELGSVAPAEFIPLAEENGLIVDLTALVLREACAAAAAVRQRRPEAPFRVSVNLSGVQLSDPAVVGAVTRALDEAALDPGLLCLEITESVLMGDAESSVISLRSLKALGVWLSVDDFGTGYSSLSYLKRFPIDQLKIDRSFTAGLGADLEDSAIVEAIVRLADVLGLEVVAEGVETATQRDVLHHLGCRFGQGWLWAPAGPIDALLDDRREGQLPPVSELHQEGELVIDPSDAAAALAHEIRNPLAVIRGHAEVLGLTLGAGDTIARKQAAAIEQSTARLERIVDLLADLRQIDRGTVELHRELLDLGHVAGKTLERLSGLLSGHEVSITGEGVTVSADPVALEQILTNLLTNEAKYTPAGTTVELVVEKRGEEARLRIIDDGPGIPVGQLEAVFRKFGRLDRTRSGVGIGLFISRGLARAHGGDLRARRSPSGGAEFELVLPLPHNPVLR